MGDFGIRVPFEIRIQASSTDDIGFVYFGNN